MNYSVVPITDSFAMQRCLTWTPPQIYPQRTAIVGRPMSAPMNQSRNAIEPLRVNVNTKAAANRDAQDSHFYSTAANRIGGESRVLNGNSRTTPSTIPQYYALNDPHLYDHYVRKFATMDPIFPTQPTSKDQTTKTKNRTRKKRKTGGKKDEKDNKEGKATYRVSVTTGSKRDAGTDAQVYITIKGSKGKLPKHHLAKKEGGAKQTFSVFKFNRGTTNGFKFDGKDVGDLTSIIMEHDGVTEDEGWFLENVKITKTVHRTGKEKSWTFVCQNWLSLHEGDCQIKRQLFTQQSSKTDYEIVVVTGNVKGAGTDAHVFVTIFGKTGQTQRLPLLSSEHSNPFERNKSDVFIVKANCVGPMTKIRIEHDNRGVSPGWFLDRVVVTDLKNTKWKYYFPCGQWLAKDEGDRQICRDLVGSVDPLGVRRMNQYKISIYTGDKRGAGTDANVYVTLFGDVGDSGEKKMDTKRRNNFEKGQKDEFVIDCPSLGTLKRLRVSHDNSGPSPGWFLDKIIVDDVHGNRVYEFPCQRWLAKDEDDGQTSRDLVCGGSDKDASPGVPYTIHVKTGDVANAGTSAGVYVVLHGGKRGETNSGKIWLTTGKFERGRTDVFNVDVAEMLSPLSRIDVGHDNKGRGAGWFLDEVVVYCPSAGIEQTFRCMKWLATDEGDGLIERTLMESGRKNKEKMSTWFIWIHTADGRGAGTDANVCLVAYGKNKNGDSVKSDEIRLDNKGNNFESGQVDKFKIEMINIGKIYKIRIGHDNSKPFAGWKLDKVEMENMDTKKRYTFHCGRWLATDEDDGSIIRELPAEGEDIKKPEKVLKYLVTVYTGKKMGSGTDANVFVDIFGEQGDTGERLLEKSSTHRNKFEKGNADEFVVEAVNLKKLKKIRIGHDGKNAGSGWFLEKVVVKPMDDASMTTAFECNRWLDVKEDDGAIVREITAGGSQMLSTTSYHVSVKTGKVHGAGTDANVFIKIFGEKGDTGKLQLKTSENTKNKFESGRTDLFNLEATDIGKIKKIRIGHDGANPGAGWFLDDVKIDVPSRGELYTFAFHRWLDKKEEDGQIEVDMEPTNVEKGSIKIPYEITVWTGDVRGAGTDSNVFVQMYGEGGKTEEYFLRNRTDNFEKGQVDKFKLEAGDVGPLLKIRVGHDGAGAFAGWFLDKILIQRHPSKTSKRRSKKARHQSEPPSSRRKSHHTMDDDSDGGMSARGHRKKYAADDYDDYEDDRKKRPYSASLHRRPSSRSSNGSRSGLYDSDSDLDRRSGSRTPTGKRRIQSPRSSSRYRDSDDDDVMTSARSNGKKKNKNHYDDDFNDYDDDDDDDYRGKGGKGKKAANHKKENVDEEEEEVEEYWFVCNRWFAKNEDDHKIVRELLPTTEDGKPLETGLHEVEYIVKVFTGDKRGAGTDANVFINITGELGDTGERQLQESNHINKFERNKEDIFKVSAVELGKLKKVKIRHDNKGGGAAWFLGHVEIEDPKSRKSYFFPCYRWLAIHEDDGQIARDLLPADKSKLSGHDAAKIKDEIALENMAQMTTYHVHVFTGDKLGAGTDANVYVVLFGEIDDTGVIFLKSSKTNRNKFERKQRDEFVVEAVDIGELKKIKIGHDNHGGGGAWYLDRVEIDSPSLGKKWYFPHSRWLAKDKDDGKLERELYPQDMATEEYAPCIPYEITTYTSDVRQAGTSADVHVTLYGRQSSTSQMSLCTNKQERKKVFDKGKRSQFVIELEDVGEVIEKLRIGHDGHGIGAGWHLDKVEVRRLKASGRGSEMYVFPCRRWLAKDEDDGAIERELVPEKIIEETTRKDGTVKKKEIDHLNTLAVKKYSVNVVTGEERGSGTDANVYLTLFGEQGDSGERQLKNSETNRNKFERGQTDKFHVEAVDLGKLHKVTIRHDNANLSPSWYLDRVEVVDPDDNETYTFHCERWLAKNKDDGKIERSIYVKGYRGDTGSGTLRGASSMGSLESGFSDHASGKSSRVSKRQSIAMEGASEGPTLPYTVRVTTGSEKHMGTESNAYIKITGKNKKLHTGKHYLDLMTKKEFRPGSIETFHLEAVDVHDVKEIEFGHDGVTDKSGWFVEKVEVDLPTKGKHYVFICKCWLATEKGDGKTSRIFTLAEEDASGVSYKPMLPYEVSFYTGDTANAGTDASVFIKVFGLKGSTSEIPIPKLEDRFERGKVDLIKMELDDVAPLKKLRVGTNGKGNRPDWFVDKVELRNMETGDLTVFNLNAWLSKTKDDKHLERDVAATVKGKTQLKETTYKISVKTSDVSSAGTDANVFVILFGENGDSGELHLKDSETNRRSFETGKTDVFTIPSILSLGQLIKLRVWHDNKGLGSAWHLGEIDVEDVSTGQKYHFPCARWLSKRDDDKQICRELSCANLPSPRTKEKITYLIEITTPDKLDGGMPHNAWIVLEGSERTSTEFLIENKSKNKLFQRGSVDSFTMISRNLGKIKQCIVGAVEGDLRGSSGKANSKDLLWFCGDVIVTNEATGDKYMFTCNDWIKVVRDISRKNARILELDAVEESQITAQKSLGTVKYDVTVVTGNESGGGTNANVFITIYGKVGDSGKRPLTQKFRDLFERGQTDNFQIEAIDLGDVKKIKIEHDNAGFRPGWFLDHVVVANKANNRSWTFPCNAWLDKSKGDKQITRELFPSNQ